MTPGFARGTHGTGAMEMTVIRTRLMRGRRLFDCRTDGGEVMAAIPSVGGRNNQRLLGLRVLAVMTDIGRWVIVGPISEPNAEFSSKSPETHDRKSDRPNDVGPDDDTIESPEGVKLIFGKAADGTGELTIIVPGLLRIQAAGVRISVAGDSSARPANAARVEDELDAIKARVMAHERYILSNVGQVSGPTYGEPGILEEPTDGLGATDLTMPAGTS